MKLSKRAHFLRSPAKPQTGDRRSSKHRSLVNPLFIIFAIVLVPLLLKPVLSRPSTADGVLGDKLARSESSETPLGVTPDAAPLPDAVGQESSPPVCATGGASASTLPMLSSDASPDISQLLSWAVKPEMGLESLVQTLGPVLAAQLSARPFPEIHDRARLARVPIMMYHDILPEKEVFFDVTPQEFEADLQLIKDNGLTPISLDQLVTHLSTGMPLPAKPILLTFDDGYRGHYDFVYPLLKRYAYPAVFAIYTAKVGTNVGRSSLTWDQLREMAADPLVTIAAHSVTHPPDLGALPTDRIRSEVVQSKRILEEQLGIPIDHFVYPSGKYSDEVKRWVQMAGYHSALTMNDEEDKFAGESDSLLSIDRIGQSKLEDVIAQVYGGPALPPLGKGFNFTAPVQVNRVTMEDIPLILISGGKPITIHADSRYQVPDILALNAQSNAIAAVDGGFFSLKYLDSNVMIGPVLSQVTQEFVPGNASENPLLNGRPLVLISPDSVHFVPFDADRHNTLTGIQAEQADVTDAFVAAAWLVKDSQPQPDAAFGKLFDFNAARHRAFWGIDQSGQPVIGVAQEPIGSVDLGRVLSQAGFRDAVMLDSGASTSLAYQGESLVGYTPRPVPHVVALVPPASTQSASPPSACTLISQGQAEQ